MAPVSPRALLANMEAAHRQTSQHLHVVRRQIAGRAERLTITAKAKARSHRRSNANWTRSDEDLYRDCLDRLTFERRGEIEALTRKLARQERALAVVRNKLGKDSCSSAA
jgi:hypothetical protein